MKGCDSNLLTFTGFHVLIIRKAVSAQLVPGNGRHQDKPFIARERGDYRLVGFVRQATSDQRPDFVLVTTLSCKGTGGSAYCELLLKTRPQ